MMNFGYFLKNAGKVLAHNSDKILLAIGIASGGAAVISGIIATKKAMPKLEKKKEELAEERDVDISEVKLPKKEVVKTVWKDYIWTGVFEGISIASLFGTHKATTKLALGASTAYEFATKNYEDLKEAAKEVVGENTVRKIEEKRAENDAKKIESIKTDDPSIQKTGTGDYLFVISGLGIVFRSGFDNIYNVANDIHDHLAESMDDTEFYSLRDFLYGIGIKDPSDRGPYGIKQIHLYDHVGWTLKHNLDLKVMTERLPDGQDVHFIYFDLVDDPNDFSSDYSPETMETRFI